MRKVLVLALGAVLLFANGAALADGEKTFKKRCGSCHTVEAGKHKSGPSLAGVIGRKAGSTDFKRYKGLVDADFTWDAANMDEWLTDPKKFLGKTTTMGVKIKKAEERAEIIEYLSKN